MSQAWLCKELGLSGMLGKVVNHRINELGKDTFTINTICTYRGCNYVNEPFRIRVVFTYINNIYIISSREKSEEKKEKKIYIEFKKRI